MMNVELLRKIQAHILAEPKRVWMGTWCMFGELGECVPVHDGVDDDGFTELLEIEMPSCGTVACISGWAALLSGYTGAYTQADRGDLLGIDPQRADRLFYSSSWPEDLRDRLELAAPQSQEYAQIVADRIDVFIKTKGRE
jgi:hypothetical protein